MPAPKLPLPPHGTRARYKRGRCTCTRCRAANATYMRAYRRGALPADPATRRASLSDVAGSAPSHTQQTLPEEYLRGWRT